MEASMRAMMRCGRTMAVLLAALLATGSPAAAHERASEAANKKLVLDFYRALDDADAAGATRDRIRGIAETYLSPDYVQHGEGLANLPGPGSARDRFVRMFQSMPAMPPLPVPRTVTVMAEGDRVMLLTQRDLPDPSTGRLTSSYVFNMFRIRDHRLAEHWDVGTPAMPLPTGGAPASR